MSEKGKETFAAKLMKFYSRRLQSFFLCLFFSASEGRVRQIAEKRKRNGIAIQPAIIIINLLARLDGVPNQADRADLLFAPVGPGGSRTTFARRRD